MTTTDKNIRELQKAGLFDEDSDYGGKIGIWVRQLLWTFQKQEHSGASAETTATIFHDLVMGKSILQQKAESNIRDKIFRVIIDDTKTPSIKFGISENGNLYRLVIPEPSDSEPIRWKLVCESPYSQ